jgi:hypothetical protein
MAFWNTKSAIGNTSAIHTNSFGHGSSQPILSEFFEIEDAVVLDVINDDKHPEIKNIVASEWTDNYKNEPANSTDKNYTYIGRICFRMLNSQIGIPKEKLSWAKPANITGVVEFPLLNEVVTVAKYRNEWYYFRRLNISGFVNNSANFNIEKTEGNTSGNRLTDFTNTNKNIKPVTGPTSYTGPQSVKTANNRGVLGNYFCSNNKIRSVKKYEGDTTLESRYGQSIRFSAYDDNRNNDRGAYADYVSPYGQINPYSGTDSGGGNPMILIRNRQRPLGNASSSVQLHPLLPPIPKIQDAEKNAGGIIKEDINNDGTSIHITSGLTNSEFKTTVYKSIFSKSILEEQSKYSPSNSTKFDLPALTGDQLIINSDRIILSSRFGETIHYSKKRYAIATDSEYTLDADDQIVLTTNNKTVLNSPAIYLGQYDETNEPVMLGQTTADWLYDLCEWLKTHIHWYNHTHPKTGNADPNQTQIPVQLAQLELIQSRIKSTLSRRVFVTGGGYAPGADGVSHQKTDSIAVPTKINTVTGDGVPGGYNAKNSRKLNV